MAKKYTFQLEFKVRDYECDLQGIVNNANYQHFYEHTRHEFLLANGISFAQLHDEGVELVVARATMAFKMPLHSRESFLSVLNMRQEGMRYVFDQKIFRLPDMVLCNSARFDSVATINGKLGTLPLLDDFVKRMTEQENDEKD
ncbi:MAG: acyl-CoA thioesterase [Paludibacteraceae bacterium]|nr:acyl-CoA thioesterase [Paludibacteraceae bacterium]